MDIERMGIAMATILKGIHTWVNQELDEAVKDEVITKEQATSLKERMGL